MFTLDLVTRFKNVNAAVRHTSTHEKYGDVKSLYRILLSIPESQSFSCPIKRSVCVCLLVSYVEPADRLTLCVTSYFQRQLKVYLPTLSNNNMVDERICQTVATKALVN